MNIGDVKNIKIARKYSNALLELAVENNNLDKVFNDFVFIMETLNSNSQLKDFLYSPIINVQDKKDVVNKIFSIHVDKTTIDFLFVLVDSNRVNILDEILNQFAKTYNKESGIVKPVVISAVELDDVQKSNVVEKLEVKLSKKILPEFKVDEDIIGGLIIEIEDKTIDCSLRTKFKNMKKQLTKGN